MNVGKSYLLLKRGGWGDVRICFALHHGILRPHPLTPPHSAPLPSYFFAASVASGSCISYRPYLFTQNAPKRQKRKKKKKVQVPRRLHTQSTRSDPFKHWDREIRRSHKKKKTVRIKLCGYSYSLAPKASITKSDVPQRSSTWRAHQQRSYHPVVPVSSTYSHTNTWHAIPLINGRIRLKGIDTLFPMQSTQLWNLTHGIYKWKNPVKSALNQHHACSYNPQLTTALTIRKATQRNSLRWKLTKVGRKEPGNRFVAEVALLPLNNSLYVFSIKKIIFK